MKLLTLVGRSEEEAKQDTDSLMQVETALAAAQSTLTEARDEHGVRVSPEDFYKALPEVDWKGWIAGLGVTDLGTQGGVRAHPLSLSHTHTASQPPHEPRDAGADPHTPNPKPRTQNPKSQPPNLAQGFLVVRNMEFLKKVSKMISTMGMEHIRAYMRFNLVHSYAALMDSRFEDALLAYNKELYGISVLPNPQTPCSNKPCDNSLLHVGDNLLLHVGPPNPQD